MVRMIVHLRATSTNVDLLYSSTNVDLLYSLPSNMFLFIFIHKPGRASDRTLSFSS